MFSSALILAVAVAVETVHPTEDLVIAERVLAPTADESADRAADIQAALDAVGVRLHRTDWERAWRLRVSGYAVGLELDRGVEGMGIENFGSGEPDAKRLEPHVRTASP